MRRLTKHDRDDRGVVTLLVIGMITVLLLASAAAIDVSRFSQENSSAQHSADATAMAVATDCVLSPTHLPQPAAAYDMYRKTPDQVISATTPIGAASCSGNKVTITVEHDVDSGLLLNRDARLVHKTAEVQWGTVGSANTLPITIASCEFTPAILDGAANVYLYLDQPSPLSGCSGGPGGFGSLTDTGSDADCLTVSVVSDVAEGGTGASDHAAQCIRDRFETILNGGGFVDVFVPIYGAYSHVGSTFNYTIIGYATFRMRGYEFNGAPGDAGTLDGGGASRNCPNIGPGNEYCLHGDFIRFTTSQGTPGPSTDFGTKQVFLSK
jgi:Flp pilus assembly protein TadG